NCKLYVLNKYFKKTYDTICREFINIFPFVNNLELKNAEDFGFNHPGIVPVLAMKEKKINKWIPLNNFSSGMKKVLLIITDIFTMPKDGAIYLIDEYENSLGKNAINFFPDILLEANPNNQFIITSHHPYIIGNVKVTDWIIMHRTGNSIKVKQGQELEEKYGKSKQQAFIQLINDPFFTEGIE
ncbi:ATP-binding protein, partial [Candidatus Nomurabacteria bacterium]|nr:ATP-binding protein [Candidatus Nomurabacteria bacterium]